MRPEPTHDELITEMANFAQFLRDNPLDAIIFLKLAGILNQEGQLRKNFGGDAE
jgi:hypothetical protein